MASIVKPFYVIFVYLFFYVNYIEICLIMIKHLMDLRKVMANCYDNSLKSPCIFIVIDADGAMHIVRQYHKMYMHLFLCST